MSLPIFAIHTGISFDKVTLLLAIPLIEGQDAFFYWLSQRRFWNGVFAVFETTLAHN